MVSQKNKSKKSKISRSNSVSSSRLHKSRTRSTSFRYNGTPARKIILIVIILTIITVAIAVICSFLFTPERIVKSRLDTLASDYYENYFFKQLSTSPDFEPTPANMSKYHELGFAPITLRQLLLYNSADADATNYLLEYCDENSTLVQFFPDDPYTNTSYHTEFHYSCTF